MRGGHCAPCRAGVRVWLAGGSLADSAQCRSPRESSCLAHRQGFFFFPSSFSSSFIYEKKNPFFFFLYVLGIMKSRFPSCWKDLIPALLAVALLGAGRRGGEARVGSGTPLGARAGGASPVGGWGCCSRGEV